MNLVTLTTVQLPDNKLALEVETINYGGSETYPTNEYYYQGNKLEKHPFNTDYWLTCFYPF